MPWRTAEADEGDAAALAHGGAVKTCFCQVEQRHAVRALQPELVKIFHAGVVMQEYFHDVIAHVRQQRDQFLLDVWTFLRLAGVGRTFHAVQLASLSSAT